ncbi:MAG: cyclic nucleotide-binding and patatin-like phospholipase domain-containing protein [Acidimicrobiia bacterium]
MTIIDDNTEDTIGHGDFTELVRTNRVLGALTAEARALVCAHLEPVFVPAGETVMRAGDAADCLYLVAAGRLRVLTSADGEERVLAEIGRGDVVGEMALIIDRPRTADVVAVRDTHLLRLGSQAFVELTAAYPAAYRAVSTATVDRLLMRQTRGITSTPAVSIAILPIDDTPAVAHFITGLTESCERLTGGARRVDIDAARAIAGDDLDRERLAAWSNDLEHDNALVLYLAETEPTPWTESCLRQADLVVVVGDATTGPALRPVEGLVHGHHRTDRRTELVLVHPAATRDPRRTKRWLEPRTIDRHHNVRDGAVEDTNRAARLILNRGVGVVFSGGGARGISQVGVYAALLDAGIPIDTAGGTSIGSIVSGGVARDMTPTAIGDLLRAAVSDRKSYLDVTFPGVSIAAGGRVTQRMREAADGLDFEDGWRRAFAVSANLTKGEVEIHRSGPGWFALRASFSLPGVFPPMRNATGDVLVDGGILDNMPVGIMRSQHDGISVIAIDVGSQRDVRAGDLPDSGVVSGWKWLIDRVNPRAASQDMVGAIKVLMRITELGGRDEDKGDLYIRPDVSGVAMLDFGAFDRLVDAGYEAGTKAAQAWIDSGTAPRF